MEINQTTRKTGRKQSGAFQRLELLTGSKALERLMNTPVILFGVGGVGSWCAEALVRSGIHHLTIVDSDIICITNINRQVQATFDTAGQVKVTALRDRLISINPVASINAMQSVYDRNTAAEFELEKYSYVIDAIDSLSSKVELIINASASGAKVYSALGASCKTDPSKIKIASLWQTEGCRLGRFVRKRLRRRGFSGEVTCVYSDELASEPYDINFGCGTGACMCPSSGKIGNGELKDWCSTKKQINGSAVHITAVFGFMLAGLVIQDIINSDTSVSVSTEAEQVPVMHEG
ncbi:MAG: tRNA threonylcarbamoyladenosine dehydratase [Fibrobacter sp.]|jgi:tRNA A37 threonylcarbamoyladenosine dehydratase|nr:tRNA threonylcarbamoyladenosine dehydratase [Fibrobacter sp.]